MGADGRSDCGSLREGAAEKMIRNFQPLSGSDKLLVVILVVCAFLLRFDLIWASDFILDSDEAIVGLMAKHINEGKGIPVFYYGQHYMGSLEAVLAAASYRLFGIGSFTLKLVPLVFSLLFLWIVFELAREIWNLEAARISLLLASFAPSTLIVWSAKARGGFIEILVIGGLALLLTVRWLKDRDAPATGMFGIAAALGVGWWVNNQIIYFMLPLGFAVLSRVMYLEDAYFLDKIRKFISLAGAGLAAFLLGSLPFWIYNFEHDFASFGMFNGSTRPEMFQHFTGLFRVSLPILLGAKQFWSEQDYFTCASPVVYLIYGVAVIFVLFARLPQVLNLFRLRLDYEKPVELLFLFLVTCMTVFVYSSFGWLVHAPRYLLPMYVAIFPLVGIAVEQMRQRLQYLPHIVLAAVLAMNLYSSYPGRRAIPGEPFVHRKERVSKNHDELISWLEEKNISWVRTNYWIGYRLAFETREKVRFMVFQEPLQSRIESYEEDGFRCDVKSMPFVLTPLQAEIVERGLKKLGYEYERVMLSGYAVLYNLMSPYGDLHRLNVGMTATASEQPDKAQRGIDGDLKSRWPSAKPQRAGMQYQVVFSEPRIVRGVALCHGQWGSDYPRGLEIFARGQDGTETLMVNNDDYSAMSYIFDSLTDCEDEFILTFPAIVTDQFRFVQTGFHPVLDWSIAELRFFE